MVTFQDFYKALNLKEISSLVENVVPSWENVQKFYSVKSLTEIKDAVEKYIPEGQKEFYKQTTSHFTNAVEKTIEYQKIFTSAVIENSTKFNEQLTEQTKSAVESFSKAWKK